VNRERERKRIENYSNFGQNKAEMWEDDRRIGRKCKN
jgi:hypothetical protein